VPESPVTGRRVSGTRHVPAHPAAARLLAADADARRCFEALTGQVPATLDGILACYSSTKEDANMSTVCMTAEEDTAYRAWLSYAGDETTEPTRMIAMPNEEYERLVALAAGADQDDAYYAAVKAAVGAD
jgi:hypothetical protein